MALWVGSRLDYSGPVLAELQWTTGQTGRARATFWCSIAEKQSKAPAPCRSTLSVIGRLWLACTVVFRDIETTFFDPASVFLSTHWWSQNPASQFLAKEACSFYKRDLFRRFSAHPASVFLKHSGRNWPNPVCSFYLPVSTSREVYMTLPGFILPSVSPRTAPLSKIQATVGGI